MDLLLFSVRQFGASPHTGPHDRRTLADRQGLVTNCHQARTEPGVKPCNTAGRTSSDYVVALRLLAVDEADVASVLVELKAAPLLRGARRARRPGHTTTGSTDDHMTGPT